MSRDLYIGDRHFWQRHARQSLIQFPRAMDEIPSRRWSLDDAPTSESRRPRKCQGPGCLGVHAGEAAPGEEIVEFIIKLLAQVLNDAKQEEQAQESEEEEEEQERQKLLTDSRIDRQRNSRGWK